MPLKVLTLGEKRERTFLLIKQFHVIKENKRKVYKVKQVFIKFHLGFILN